VAPLPDSGQAAPSEAAGAPSVSGPQTVWAPVGSRPRSDALAAAFVAHRPEQRPENRAANDYVPSSGEIEAFRTARNAYGETSVQWNPLYAYVDGLDGLHEPSTDDLIQWAAHKWGIPEDWLRAEYTQESWWRQSTLGDRTAVSAAWYASYPAQAQVPGTSEAYESMGITQVKWLPDGSVGAGTEPLRWKSTAFNVDYQAATVRYYFDGLCSWCTSGYSAGQEWNSIGAWYSPYPWANSGAQAYIKEVQGKLLSKPWGSPGF
jgi:hypothetical protein